MNVTIVKADPSRLAECREVFLDSALYDHYFTAEGRLEGMLATAVEKGELWLAVTSRNEVAGVMWMEMTGFFDVFPYLALLGVKKSFRGMGVGHVLLRTFEGCLPCHGVPEGLPYGESLQSPGQSALPVHGLSKGGLCARRHRARSP